MEQRNTLCTHQMADLHSVEGHSYNRHDHRIFPGNIVDSTNFNTNPNMQLVLPASGNSADLALQFKGYHDRVMFYGDHYNNSQNFYPFHNLGPIVPATPNFSDPCMVPSSASRIFPVQWNNGSIDHLQSSINQREIRNSMGEFGVNNHSIDARGPDKRKISEAVPGNRFNMNGMASSTLPSLFPPLNSGLPQWEQSYEMDTNLVDATNFAQIEHQDRGIVQMTEGSNRSMSRSRAICHQPETAFSHNYLLQESHMGQSLLPTSKINMWTTQFSTGNNITNGACSNWNYTCPATYMHGRCLGSRPFGIINMDAYGYNGASSSSNAAILSHQASVPDFNQHMPPVQTMQVQSYVHSAQVQAHTYQNTLNNLYPVNINPLSNAPESGPALIQFPSNAAQMYRHWQLHPVTPEFSHGNLRLLPSQDATTMEISGAYGGGTGNVIDHHQDMRLDIDEMSYEELLALEEQIGNVGIGLTEEYIRKNLETTVHNLQIKSLPAGQCQEAESCTICQVEYEQDGIIGTIDCGHRYHGDCIKQWLLLKNICPICKSTALTKPESVKDDSG